MHDLLFQNQHALQREQLQGYADQLHLDVQVFRTCLEDHRHRALVQQDYDEGISAGVRGTPAFFFGKTRPDGEAIEGVLISGARPLHDFRQEIERALTEK